MQAEMEELIEGICSTYKDFSQKQADTASLLDCIAAEELQRGSAVLETLPELEEGPDEVLYSCSPLEWVLMQMRPTKEDSSYALTSNRLNG